MRTEVEPQDPFERIYNGLHGVLKNCCVEQEQIDTYLRFMFDDEQLTDDIAHTSEIVNRAFFTSLGRVSLGQPEYTFSEQSIIGLIAGRDFSDTPRSVSAAIEEFADSYGGTELLVDLAVKSLVSGVEKLEQRSAANGFRGKFKTNLDDMPEIMKRRQKRLNGSRQKTKS